MPRVQVPAQAPNGKWFVRVVGPDGKRHKRTFESQEDALAALGRHRDVASKERAGTLPKGASLTVREASESWCKRRREGRQRRASESHFRVHIVPALGDLRLIDIDDDVIVDFVRSLEEKDAARKGQKAGRPLRSQTIKHVLVTLGKFLSDKGFPRRIKYTVQAPDYRWIEKAADVGRFLDACAEVADEWFKVAAAIAVYTGARAGEVASFRRADLDFAHGQIRVSKSHGGPTKSRRGRWVPLPPELAAVLKPWLLKSGTDLVVARPDGTAIVRDNGDSLAPLARAACRRCGIPEIVFHDLRHTAASHWALGGMSLLEIATLLGHSTVVMVQRYAHLQPEALVRSPRAHLSFLAPHGKVLPLDGGDPDSDDGARIG